MEHQRHVRAVVLPTGVSLLSGTAEPPDSFPVVLHHPETVAITDAEVVLRAGVVLFGRSAVPPDRFRVVPHYPATSRVHEAKGSLPGGVALFSRSPKPGHGNVVVLHQAATVLIPLAELGLRLSISRLGQLSQSSDVQLGYVSLRRIRAVERRPAPGRLEPLRSP